jgi:RNA polymerase sigma-70 factor (ECF subfamily)
LDEETEENRDNEIDDNIQQVLHLKDQLPPSQLQIFELVMDGYKHKEIAKKLNIHEGTSKSNFYKAKGNIRKNLLTKI